jgi:hypothetical protein
LAALDAINRDGDFEKKIYELNAQLKEAKTEYREMYNSHLEQEKDLIEKHDQLVQTNMKIRKIERAIKSKSDSSGKDVMPMDLTEGKLQELEKEIKRAEQDRITEEKDLRHKALESE